MKLRLSSFSKPKCWRHFDCQAIVEVPDWVNSKWPNIFAVPRDATLLMSRNSRTSKVLVVHSNVLLCQPRANRTQSFSKVAHGDHDGVEWLLQSLHRRLLAHSNDLTEKLNEPQKRYADMNSTSRVSRPAVDCEDTSAFFLFDETGNQNRSFVTDNSTVIFSVI